MKAFAFVPLLFLAACAPKALPVDEADVPSQPQPKPVDSSSQDDLPPLPENDGLLEPSGLTQMPSRSDMKSAATDEANPVIANPPTSDE